LILLVLFLALLSPWLMVLSALLYAMHLEDVELSKRNHPSAARSICPVCGAHVIPQRNNS
jgi:hypothetical protein